MTGRYTRLLALPHARRLVLVEFPARLPIGVLGLAILLFVREHYGSYSAAGITAGAFAAVTAISNPLLGRMVDRRGLRTVLIPASVAHAAGIVGLIVAGTGGAPLAAVVGAAALCGAALPPLGPVTRLIWPAMIEDGGEDPGLFATALAIESILIDIVFAVGPLLAAGVATVIDPAAALALSPLLMAIGLVGLLSLAPVKAWQPAADAEQHGPLGALRSSGLWILMVTLLPVGFCFGSVEVILPAFAEQHGDRSIGGVLIAVWALGSAIGGFLYGAVAWRSPLPRRWGGLTLLMPVTYAPLLLADSHATMAFLSFLAGMSIAPVLTSSNQIINDVALPGTLVEAFVWPITTMVFGAAVGNVVAGALVTHSSLTLALTGSAIAATLGAAIAVALHRRLPVAVTPLG